MVTLTFEHECAFSDRCSMRPENQEQLFWPANVRQLNSIVFFYFSVHEVCPFVSGFSFKFAVYISFRSIIDQIKYHKNDQNNKFDGIGVSLSRTRTHVKSSFYKVNLYARHKAYTSRLVKLNDIILTLHMYETKQLKTPTRTKCFQKIEEEEEEEAAEKSVYIRSCHWSKTVWLSC